jgi:hypothetical protein
MNVLLQFDDNEASRAGRPAFRRQTLRREDQKRDQRTQTSENNAYCKERAARLAGAIGPPTEYRVIWKEDDRRDGRRYEERDAVRD